MLIDIVGHFEKSIVCVMVDEYLTDSNSKGYALPSDSVTGKSSLTVTILREITI